MQTLVVPGPPHDGADATDKARAAFSGDEQCKSGFKRRRGSPFLQTWHEKLRKLNQETPKEFVAS